MKYNGEIHLQSKPEKLELTVPNAHLVIFPTDVEMGRAAAEVIYEGLHEAESAGRNYVLGCPGGRSARSTYQALGVLVSTRKQPLKHLYIAMMDEYVEQIPGGEFRNIDEESHFSCRGFALREIRDVLNSELAQNLQLPIENVLIPKALSPAEYEDHLGALGVDCFLLASGTTDGHVAFNGRGTARSAVTRVAALAEETRRDNMHTFPDFKTLEEVPKFGVTVGPQTIASISKRAIMLLQGTHKQGAFQRIISAKAYETDWPATIIKECRHWQIFATVDAANSR